MKDFLLQCIANDVEYNTFTSIDLLLEDEGFKQLAKKLLKNVNQDNYEDIANELSSYANCNIC
tara:strand:- start:209 stop:397 length:189 start_codon:yes stop_codon:yes gene_type:complete